MRIPPPTHDLSLFISTMIPQESHPSCNLIVISDDGSTVTESSKQLRGIETKGTRHAKTSC